MNFALLSKNLFLVGYIDYYLKLLVKIFQLQIISHFKPSISLKCSTNWLQTGHDGINSSSFYKIIFLLRLTKK